MAEPAIAPKDELRRLVESLPEDATVVDLQYHLYVRQKIENGLSDAENGRTLTEAEFEARISKWLVP